MLFVQEIFKVNASHSSQAPSSDAGIPLPLRCRESACMTAKAAMLTIRRTVAEGKRICTGGAAPSKIPPILSARMSICIAAEWRARRNWNSLPPSSKQRIPSDVSPYKTSNFGISGVPQNPRVMP
jgi:hypothetical protein